MAKEQVIITAGGTKEAIDDVRFITNFSTGRLGHNLARELDKRDTEVTVLCPEEVPVLSGGKIPGVSYQSFTDTDSLQSALLSHDKQDIIIHSAAVSDYTPITVSGKIRSDQDTLTIECVRTPKILPQLRNHFGKRSFLVGFKLLSGVSREELIKAAVAQGEHAHLNLTVANDLKKIDRITNTHPLILVTREGGTIDLVGSKEEVAGKLAEFILKRSRVSWYDVRSADAIDNLPGFNNLSTEDKTQFERLLKFAQTSNLLFDISGNVSMRSGDHLVVTPAKADKRFVTVDQLATAHVDHQKRSLVYKAESNPSIDTAVSDYLYKKFPHIKFLLHFHRPWGRSDVKTSFPYPCGVVEEAIEIESKLQNQDHQEGFVVDLIHHGFLVGLPEGGVEKLEQSWHESWQEFTDHLKLAKAEFTLDEGLFRPIFSGTTIVGVFREHQEGGVAYLRKQVQRGLTGPRVMEQLKERRMPILTVNECNVVDRYIDAYGFRKGELIGERVIKLYPPEVTGSDPIFK
jgi:phosphopantothenate---cysteine ligase (CTP)